MWVCMDGTPHLSTFYFKKIHIGKSLTNTNAVADSLVYPGPITNWLLKSLAFCVVVWQSWCFISWLKWAWKAYKRMNIMHWRPGVCLGYQVCAMTVFWEAAQWHLGNYVKFRFSIVLTHHPICTCDGMRVLVFVFFLKKKKKKEKRTKRKTV